MEATQHSPGVRRMAALAGSETSFERGRALLDELAGVALTAKAVEREAEAIGAGAVAREQSEIGGPPIPVLYIEMDGTAVPASAAETAGRRGRDGGAARTREVKLGCVFTQSRRDEQGRPVRDADSTKLHGRDRGRRRLFTEAWRGRWSRARQKVVLGDGAPWIWNLAHEYFPGAVEIIDLYHARQHLWELAGKLFPNQEKRRRGSASRLERQLVRDRVEAIAVWRRGLAPAAPSWPHQLALEADYFERNAERMRYEEFRRQGLFVGSRVIEAGCRTMIARRPEAFGHVLERARRQRHHGLALRPPLRPLRRLLRITPPHRLSVTNLQRTPCFSPLKSAHNFRS